MSYFGQFGYTAFSTLDLFNMAKALAKQTNSNVTIIVAVIAALLVVAMIAWFYSAYKQQNATRVNYASFGPMIVNNEHFAVRATINVQTRGDADAWVKQNSKELEFAFRSALAKADYTRLRQLGNIVYVQTLLRDAVSTSLDSHEIDDILLTDFIMQSE